MRQLKWFLVLCSCALSASAGVLSTSGSVTIGGGGSLCSNSATNSTSPVTGDCTNGTTTGAFKAQSDYGLLKAYASFLSTNENANTVEVLGNASFTDFLSLTSTGAPATIDFIFTVTGTGISGTGGFMRLSASAPAATPLTATAGAGTYTFTAPYAPIIPTDPFTLILTASLQARTFIDNGGPGPWSGGATSDFYSTATLSSIVVYDAGHNDITDTVNITGGAASYPLGGGGDSAVPEPSTLVLTAGAATALVIHRRRARA